MSQIKKRLNSNNADGMVILMLFVIVVILLVTLFVIDLSKSSFLRNQYEMMAQTAAAVGIKEQNVIGGFNAHEAANRAIREYLILRDPHAHGVVQTNQTGPFRHICQPSGNFPYITVEFAQDRAIGTVPALTRTASGPNASVSIPAQYNDNTWRVLSLTITDVGDGSFSGLFGRQCNTFTVSVSAVAADAHYIN